MRATFLLPLQEHPLSSDSLFVCWLSDIAGDGEKREATEPETSPSEHLCFLNESFPKPGRSYIQHQGQRYGTCSFSLLTGNPGSHIHLLFQLPSQHGTSKGPSPPTPPSSTSLPWQACLPQLASPTPPHLLFLFLLGCSLL